MVKLIVSGVAGRMGRRIAGLSLADSEIKVTGGLEIQGNPGLGEDLGKLLGLGEQGIEVVDNLEKIIGQGDVLVEFSSSQATLEHLQICQGHKKAMVIGTTGFTEDEKEILNKASKDIPLLCSPNMSVGINLLFKITREAAKAIGQDYDLEIIEAHHRQKKDAPSGTAIKLAAILAKETNRSLSEVVTFGRKGQTGERPRETIGIHAVRGGDIVGEHTVIFAGAGERIELTHRASSRDTFAQGALRAVKFIIKQKPGLYDMGDVLGLK